jgi:hypothetical protein
MIQTPAGSPLRRIADGPHRRLRRDRVALGTVSGMLPATGSGAALHGCPPPSFAGSGGGPITEWALRELRAREQQPLQLGSDTPGEEESPSPRWREAPRPGDRVRQGAARPRRGGGRAAVVSNGLSLCSIHHRAFDQDLVGVAPDLRVHVSRRLLEDEDGPMLDVLKGFHGAVIEVPSRRLWRPDPERLEARFARFRSAA